MGLIADVGDSPVAVDKALFIYGARHQRSPNAVSPEPARAAAGRLRREPIGHLASCGTVINRV